MLSEKNDACENTLYKFFKNTNSFTRSDLFCLVIENLPDQIYLKDTQGNFLLCNLPVALNAGCNVPEDLIGKTDFDFSPPETANKFLSDEKILMTTGVALINHEEHYFNKETNEINWNLTTKVPIKNEQNEVVGLLGINRDITDDKKALLAREQTMADLEHRNNELEKFTHIVSHSLRLPVANILGLSALIADLDPDSALDNKVIFKNIAESAKKLDSIIHQLNEILEERNRAIKSQVDNDIKPI